MPGVVKAAHVVTGSAAAPSANRKRVRSAKSQYAVAPISAPAAAEGRWKKLALGAIGIAAVVGILFVGYNLGGGGGVRNGATGDTAQASATAPAVDQAKVSSLMGKLQANPQDTTTLQALGDEFYKGGEYTQAASFYDQLLAIDPKNIKALLARGATYFNVGDLTNAQKTWTAVVVIEPKNQEVHYDLGFLYLNQPSPNWAGVKTEWDTVISIDSTTSLANLVQQHLTSLAQASMLPASSPAVSAGASAAPSGSGSPAPSASASTRP